MSEIKIYSVPTMEELNLDPAEAFKNDAFKYRLNTPPPDVWIKKNSMANNSKYLPIDKTEFLLDRIFQEWRIEVLREGVMFNSVYVTVRVHYKNPLTGIWSYHDGVGAKDIQHDSGTTLSLETIKAAGVQMALPTAKSLAIKDACDHLGKIFGRDLNRKDTIAFEGIYMNEKKQQAPEEERILKLIAACKTRKELEKYKNDLISQEARDAFDEAWKNLR